MNPSRLLVAAASACLLASFVPCHAQQEEVETEQKRVVMEGRKELINDVDQATVAMYPATPYIESSTMMLADFDLTKLDMPAVVTWMRDHSVGPADPNIAMISGFLKTLTDAGVDHVMVTASTRIGVDRAPLVVIPCENTEAIGALLQPLLKNAPPNPALAIHVGEEVVLVGPKTSIERVRPGEGTERPDLVLPVKRDRALDHTIVVSLPDESREELLAFWPEQMPGQLPLQVSPRQLAADVLRVTVTLRLPPEPSMILRINASNQEAAERTKSLLEQLVALGGELTSSINVASDGTTVQATAPPEAFVKAAMQASEPARARAQTQSTINSLKYIGLAIHNYYDKEKHLPPRCFVDRQGKPLHSIRVALLPYIEQLALYRAMKLDQPWDSEANQMFASTRIPLYCDQPDQHAKTTIRFPVYPGSAWHGEGPPKTFRDVTDGTSNTIAAIDAPDSAAIEWANPDPWVLSEEDPAKDVLGDRDSVPMLFLDGSVRVFSKEELTNERLRSMLTIGAGD